MLNFFIQIPKFVVILIYHTMKPVKKAEKNAMAKAHKIALGMIAGVAAVTTVAFTFQDGLSLSRFTQSI